MRDRRRGREFDILVESDDFGSAWMDHLKEFFFDWKLTTDEILALLDQSAKMARQNLVPKPD